MESNNWYDKKRPTSVWATCWCCLDWRRVMHYDYPLQKIVYITQWEHPAQTSFALSVVNLLQHAWHHANKQTYQMDTSSLCGSQTCHRVWYAIAQTDAWLDATIDTLGEQGDKLYHLIFYIDFVSTGDHESVYPEPLQRYWISSITVY